MSEIFPCKCGHGKNAHFWYGVCSSISFPFNKAKRRKCFCEEFRPDNLKYLEQLYDKQK